MLWLFTRYCYDWLNIGVTTHSVLLWLTQYWCNCSLSIVVPYSLLLWLTQYCCDYSLSIVMTDSILLRLLTQYCYDWLNIVMTAHSVLLCHDSILLWLLTQYCYDWLNIGVTAHSVLLWLAQYCCDCSSSYTNIESAITILSEQSQQYWVRHNNTEWAVITILSQS